MKQGVLYARVSSREQEREGYSIPAQIKLNNDYALKRGVKIVREFIDIETAKNPGRKQFGEMVRFFEKHPNCRVVIVEKTDRLYRNFRDSVTLEDLGVEIHLTKEGQVLNKDSKSQAKLMHGFQLLIARNYIENLREEVKKGMKREGRARSLSGPRSLRLSQQSNYSATLKCDSENAEVVKRIFELYANGDCSLADLRQIIRTETGKAIAKSHIHDGILRNPFYLGFFTWDGRAAQRHTSRDHQPRIIPARTRCFRRTQPNPSTRNTNSPLVDCSPVRMTIAWSRLNSRSRNTPITVAPDIKGKCDLPRMTRSRARPALGQIAQEHPYTR